MKYQLVVQLAEDFGLDKLISIEDLLTEKLFSTADVDGHDIGRGQMNIFIFTESPLKLLYEILYILKNDSDVYKSMKVAYRGGQR